MDTLDKIKGKNTQPPAQTLGLGISLGSSTAQGWQKQKCNMSHGKGTAGATKYREGEGNKATFLAEWLLVGLWVCHTHIQPSAVAEK